MKDDEKTIEEKLSEMEKKMNTLIEQVNNLKIQGETIENILNLLQLVANTLHLSQAPFNIVRKTHSITQRIIERNPFLKYDGISRAIIQALERKGPMNISQLTEAVKKERGTASRRIVRERVEKLLKKGIIVEDEEGFGRRIRLEEQKKSE